MKRAGVAAVECAIVLPMLVIIVFGGIEVSHFVSLQHAAKRISHAAATDVILSFRSDDEIEQKYETLAASTGIQSAQVTVSDFSDDIASVRVQFPCNENATIVSLFRSADIVSDSFVYRGE